MDITSTQLPAVHDCEIKFSQPLLQWFDKAGRKDLPWQHNKTPYRIWIAESMLQQTQVKTVIPYFERFMATFPELAALATADEEQVLALWSGLGYYSRARYLHQTAKIIHQDYQGIWPQTVAALSSLPGIGRSTAGAIAAQAFNQKTAILDGNVKRVLCRYFQVEGYPENTTVKKTLWELAELCTPAQRCADYTQAIMDLGATCCTMRAAQCTRCPLNNHCLAYLNHCVERLPTKKAKKTIPTKNQQFLLIYNEAHQIYLEKNPAQGLWASLWCLPRRSTPTPPKSSPRKIIKQWESWTLPEPAREFMRFKHSFTHFHLNIQVLLLPIATTSIHPPLLTPGKWFTTQEVQSLGVPKPVQQIILHFENESMLKATPQELLT